MSTIGVIANLYAKCGKWEMSVLKNEELCEYAEAHAPNSLPTAG